MSSARFRQSCAGFTLPEGLLAVVIVGVIFAALCQAAITLQRSYAASDHFAAAGGAQLRLLDYIGVDLRRAISVTPGTTADELVTMTVPNFYTNQGVRRTPSVGKTGVSYGNQGPATVRYYKQGSMVFREEKVQSKTTTQTLATDVLDFGVQLEKLGTVVKTSVAFRPRFPTGRATSTTPSEPTRVATTTLLRNIVFIP